MSWLMRAMAVIPLIAAAGFCGFGFLATGRKQDCHLGSAMRACHSSDSTEELSAVASRVSR